MTTPQEKEPAAEQLKAIEERAKSSSSFGYGFTHYKPDVLALLSALRASQSRVARLEGALADLPLKVPDSWLDELLTGKGAPKYDNCQHIEWLLNGIRKRINDKAREASRSRRR